MKVDIAETFLVNYMGVTGLAGDNDIGSNGYDF